MNCTTCNKEMAIQTCDPIQFFQCTGPCKSLWFDKTNYQLLKKKEVFERLDFTPCFAQNDSQEVSLKEKLKCLSCKTIVLMTNFYSSERKTKIKHCAGCGGHFFCQKEFKNFVENYMSEDEKNLKFNSYADKVFSSFKKTKVG